VFILDRSFKFFKYQIGPLSFTFVLDRSFKFFKYQIGSLSFNFISNKSYYLRTSITP
jgi:hypothetical protein